MQDGVQHARFRVGEIQHERVRAEPLDIAQMA